MGEGGKSYLVQRELSSLLIVPSASCSPHDRTKEEREKEEGRTTTQRSEIFPVEQNPPHHPARQRTADHLHRFRPSINLRNLRPLFEFLFLQFDPRSRKCIRRSEFVRRRIVR